MWAPSCTHGRVCERSLPHTQTSRSRTGRYATMAERGKAGAVLIGARVTGAASPGFDVQTGRPVSRGHYRGSPTAAGCGLASTLEAVTLTPMWMLSKPAGHGME